MIENGEEKRLLNKLLEVLREKKLLKARGRQRTDSTHVLAAIRNLSRLERVGETLRAALNALANVIPEWVKTNIPMEWVERYERRIEDYRLPEGDKERKEYAAIIGMDGHKLLDMIYAKQSPQWLREIPAIEILRLVWLYNFQILNGMVELRDKDNIPAASIHIDSPYDRDAHFGRKRNKTWVGYKVHLTETCDKDNPEIITSIQTEKSTKGDNDTIPDIHQSLSVVELLPSKHIVDGGYIEAKSLFESQADYGIDLFGPPPGNRFWQSRQGTGFDISNFKIDWERQTVICPMGKISRSWKSGFDQRGNEVINTKFAQIDCKNCESRVLCTQNEHMQRAVNIKPRHLHEALQQARVREQTDEFKQEYKIRSGIEATISQGVRAFGLRHSRYLGMAKTHLQHLATAAAINLHRLSDWFSGHKPTQVKPSAFARVMQPLLA